MKLIKVEYTAWKVSVCGVFLIKIQENTDQKNSQYGRFSSSDSIQDCTHFIAFAWKKPFWLSLEASKDWFFSLNLLAVYVKLYDSAAALQRCS